jgi:hypothetical protein
MMDGVPESIVKRSGHLMSLQQAHFPYRNIGFKDLVIPRGTTGHIRGKMVHWQVKVSFWDVAIGEIQLLCQQVIIFIQMSENYFIPHNKHLKLFRRP